MVVRYSPPGNVRGKYEENVPEPGDSEYSKELQQVEMLRNAKNSFGTTFYLGVLTFRPLQITC